MARDQEETSRTQVALVGADTLLGRELQERLEADTLAAGIRSFAASGEGNFGNSEGEAVYLEPLDSGSVRDCKVIVLAGSEQGARKAYDVAREAGGTPAVIDCGGYLEQRPETRIAAPLAERTSSANMGWLSVVAHPAATALVVALGRIAKYSPIERAVVEIFEPASERGNRGLSELQQQTTNLLSFKQLTKDIFDAQASFNMLAQYGSEAPVKLSDVEQRIERDVASILSRAGGNPPVPMPSLRVIQAPVFHGYSLSIWVEMARNVDPVGLGEAVASADIEVRGPDEEAPNNVGVASQSGLIAGDIRVDRNNRRAAWLWLVGDNLRLMSDSVVELVNRLMEQK